MWVELDLKNRMRQILGRGVEQKNFGPHFFYDEFCMGQICGRVSVQNFERALYDSLPSTNNVD